MRQFRFMGLVVCLLPVVAVAFPIDVTTHMDGVKVSAVSGDMSNIATVTLTNEGVRQALCETTFINGPERPEPRRVRLAPGDRSVVTQSFVREINRVRITVDCAAQ